MFLRSLCTIYVFNKLKAVWESQEKDRTNSFEPVDKWFKTLVQGFDAFVDITETISDNQL